MALRGHSVQIFTQEWQEALAPTAEAGMAAEIVIFTIGEQVYDYEAHEYIADNITHYEGIARVQPIRMEVQAYQIGNPTSYQNIRIQIPISANFDIKTGMKVEVPSSPLNPVLEAYRFEVSKIMDSSNPFERTFQCTLDQEVRKDG